MDIKNRREMKEQADSVLQNAACNPQRLTLIYSGVVLGVSLLITLINFIISKQIASTGGLSGMGMRSVLTTIQSVLQFANTLLLPFWEAGFIAATIFMVQGKSAAPDTLLNGFRRFGTLLLLFIMEGILISSLGFFAFNLGMGLYALLPISGNMTAAMTEMMELAQSTGQMPTNPAMIMNLLRTMLPGIVISLIFYGLLAIPAMYRLRMARYLALDNRKVGTMMAFMVSIRMTRKHCMDLFKLDLSFWWYYLLQGLLILVCYGDVILGLLHVELPMSADVSYFLFYGIYALLQFGLMLYAKAKVQTTYSVAFDRLKFNLTNELTASIPEQT